MVAVVTRGHWVSAVESGIAIGIVCGGIGLVYRAAIRFRRD